MPNEHATVPASAEKKLGFEFVDGPNSGIDTTHAERTIEGNTATYSGFEAFNATEQTLSDVVVFVPFAWPRVDEADGSVSFVAMDWDTEKGGWWNPDVLGTTLLLTLQIVTSDSAPNEQIDAGTIASHKSLTHVFGPTSDDLKQPYPEETLHPGDMLPAVDLGSFEPHEVKEFDLIFTYDWGDDRVGALRTAGYISTAEPVDSLF
jgi:hypothetical protein